MKWLGHLVPALARERPADRAEHPAQSVDLALQLVADVRAIAEDKGIPLGVSVESASIRAEEIEASAELFEALPARM